MTASLLDRKPAIWPALLALALACASFWLYQRSAGLYPTVFADEWYYSKMARLMPLAEAIVPSYLYLWIFGASKACGPDFLDCVRAGNLVFFIAAAPFLYLTARKYTGPAWSFTLALAATLAPLNVYTAYFMPEATYYFGFCVLSWLVLTRARWHWAAIALAGGAVLGVMSLVKVHALFLIPALCLYLVYASWHAGGPWLLRGLLAAILAGTMTVAAKFGLGWLLAGEAGLSLLGPFYQGAVNSGSASARLALLAPAFINGRGHLEALAVLMAVPLAILLHGMCSNVLRERGTAANPLQVWVFLMLGAAAGMTVMYTATLAGPDNHEGVRLHLRYYSFVFPLVWLVAMAAAGDRRNLLPRLRWVLAALMAALLALALLKLPTYRFNVVDGPDIAGIDLNTYYGMALVGIQLLLLALWAARRQVAAALFVLTALPLSLLLAQVRAETYLVSHAPPGLGDRAGELARELVPEAERGKVVVVGDDLGQIMRAQFHIDHPDSVPLLLPTDAPIAEYEMPVTQRWMLLIGKHALPTTATTVGGNEYYSLVRLPEPEPAIAHASLAGPVDGKLITAIEGLSVAEPWGRWSDSAKVVIHFAQPLPRRVGVVLNARAFDVNATLPFKIQVGADQAEFRLGWQMRQVSMHFETDGTARSLVIEVPRPISPAELGSPGDPRKLGIGISDITLTQAPVPAQAAR